MQRRQIVNILQTLARGLNQDRKIGILARHRQQFSGAQPLLPERRALAGVTARKQQGARRAFAKAGGKQRRVANSVSDRALQGIGIELKQLGAWHAAFHIGKARDDAVIARHDSGIQPHSVADAIRDRQRPGRIHPLAPRRVQDHAPVAGLIAAAFNQKCTIGRQQPCRLALFRYQRLNIMLCAGIKPCRLTHDAGTLFSFRFA